MKKARETETTLRAETAAIADLLEEALGRIKRLATRADRLDSQNPRPDDDPRLHSFAEWVYAACECALIGEELEEVATDFRKTSRATDADLCRMKLEEEAANAGRATA